MSEEAARNDGEGTSQQPDAAPPPQAEGGQGEAAGGQDPQAALLQARGKWVRGRGTYSG